MPRSPKQQPLERKSPGRRERPGERIAYRTTWAAGLLILVALGGVAVFLIIEGLPALRAEPGELGGGASSFWALAGPLAFGTIWSATLALLISTPIAIGVALFITHYAPRRLAGGLGYIIDLLAAVPSVVYGLWGLMVFAPATTSVYAWLADHLGWIPLFAGQPSATGRTILTAALVLAVMILPIMTSMCREVFRQTPVLHSEAALALGATRWEMIRIAVFPYSRSAMVSAAMLGLGRALGETMAVAMVLSPTPFLITFRLLGSSNPNTIAARIAQTFPEAHGIGVNALIGLGLVLFCLTFVVNFTARWVVGRRAEFSGSRS